MTKQIWLNLPVKDVAKAKDFFWKIGFSFNEQHDTYNLSICAVQAILILENTEKSWRFFNELSDLINNGFNR